MLAFSMAGVFGIARAVSSPSIEAPHGTRRATLERIQFMNVKGTKLVWLLVAMLGACGGEETAEEAPAEPAPSAESAANEAPAAEEANAEAAPEGAAEGAAAAAQGLQGALGALGEALQAGTNTEATGSNCEQAFDGMMAMVNAMRKSAGGGGEDNTPNRDEFISACGELPEAAQQCMVMSYGIAHQEECRTVMESPEVAAKVAELRQRLGT